MTIEYNLACQKWLRKTTCFFCELVNFNGVDQVLLQGYLKFLLHWYITKLHDFYIATENILLILTV